MPAFVNLGGIQFGGSSNQVGVYSGQNMQNGWDSNSPNLSLFGTAMGQYCWQGSEIAVLNAIAPGTDNVIDNDVKVNGSPLLQGL